MGPQPPRGKARAGEDGVAWSWLSWSCPRRPAPRPLTTSSRLPPTGLDAYGGVIVVENNLGSAWSDALEDAIAEWERSPSVRLELGPAGTCDDGIGMIELCAAPYPGSSWPGLTSLYRGADEHFDYAVVDLNLSKRWRYQKRRFVLCHELGHTIGLAHRPETTGSSCMLAKFKYLTNKPARADAHDLEMVNGLYGHAHTPG